MPPFKDFLNNTPLVIDDVKYEGVTYRNPAMETLIRSNADFIVGKEKLNIPDGQITSGELLVGFYSEKQVSFDLYVGDEFKYHYVLSANEFSYVKNQVGSKLVLPIITNLTGIYAKNISSQSLYDGGLYYISVGLNNDKRREILISCVKEFQLE